jgi:HEAT repeat protein
VRGLNELERPLAAELLLAQLAETTAPEKRAVLLDALDESGAIELMTRSLRRRMPWRRALAAHMLGRCAARDAVPELLAHLDDRNRGVREAVVRALGRIGDERALAPLTDLYLGARGTVGSGLVYEALTGLGPGHADAVFIEGLRSTNERTRVAACYGIATLLEAERARPLLARALADPVASVRAAAAETLGRIGGSDLPEHLSRATRDEHRSVRRAAVTALASFDNSEAVTLAWTALHDPDRDTAIRAGEALVHLERLPRAGSAARATLAAADEQWPLRRALTLAELGAV